MLWPSLRRSSAPNTLIRPLASTTSRSCFKAQGELVGARPLFERALAIREQAFESEHPGTNRARYNLSGLFLLIGRPGPKRVL